MAKHTPLSDDEILHMKVRYIDPEPERELEVLQEEKQLLLGEVKRLRALMHEPA